MYLQSLNNLLFDFNIPHFLLLFIEIIQIIFLYFLFFLLLIHLLPPPHVLLLPLLQDPDVIKFVQNVFTLLLWEEEPGSFLLLAELQELLLCCFFHLVVVFALVLCLVVQFYDHVVSELWGCHVVEGVFVYHYFLWFFVFVRCWLGSGTLGQAFLGESFVGLAWFSTSWFSSGRRTKRFGLWFNAWRLRMPLTHLVLDAFARDSINRYPC